MTSAPAPPATSFEPVPDGSVTSPRGFTAAAAHAGLKTDGALDVALLVSATSCATAGVFTKNAVRAAPVIYDADLLSERPGRIRAIAMNARVANACTGPEGLAAARAMAQAAEPATLQPLLRRVGDRSFNAISVDGDTSTNDTALLLANGASGVDPGRDGAVWKLFEEAVQHVARALALAIVEDGEGASKLVEIQVVGAASEASAREVGRAIARSTLVKTAIYGADPNWGRILAAAGAAGVALAVERLTLQAAVNGEWLTLAQGGATAHPDPERAHAIFRQKTIRLRIDLGLGRAEAVVWTCDLTPDYVRINADYTS